MSVAMVTATINDNSPARVAYGYALNLLLNLRVSLAKASYSSRMANNKLLLPRGLLVFKASIPR